MNKKRFGFLITLVIIVSTMLTACNSGIEKDRSEISDKMGLYTFAWDEGKPEEFKKFYTDDVKFTVWMPGKKKLFYKFEGLKENMNGNKITNPIRDNGGSIRHNLSKVVFLELTKNNAKTKTVYTFSIFTKTSSGSPMIISGIFNDSWIKTDDRGWVVKERVIVYDNFPTALLPKK